MTRMTTPPFDPDLPDPFNIKKKTVRMPALELIQQATPVEMYLINGQREAQEDRNTLVAAQQWQNTMIWNRLKEGDDMLGHLRTIAICIKWLLGIFAGALVIFLGDGAVHLVWPK